MCVIAPNHTLFHQLIDFSVLDPRISYQGLKLDYENDPQLLEYLESSKRELQDHYDASYSNKHNPPSRMANTVTSTSSSPTMTLPPSPQKNFTSRFQRKTNIELNELDEFFKLQSEDFDTCNPIQWWMSRRSQFPNLFWLARDILCIPGLSCFTEMLSGLLIMCFKDQQLQSNVFSQAGAILFRCAVQVFGLKQSRP